MKKIALLFISLCFCHSAFALTLSELKQQSASDELLFLSFNDHPDLFIDADSVQHLRRYHNQYLREPMYDDYLHVVLQTMLGRAGFQHLFRNLGGGFVPIRIVNEQLMMKGTRDHCGGMEEALIMVDMRSGDVSSVLYSEGTFLIHSTYPSRDQLPTGLLQWIERILNAYGSRDNPTRNKVLLRKMAGDWCHANGR
ncbi:MAG: hypothetical protein KC477_01450 [Oceanospirillaceae bacterium]|nr:hypothetical protein [Oceanospirillaceae bacterium]